MAVLTAVIVKCSYCFSDRWNSLILSFWAPIHSGLLYDPAMSGSSKGLESPLKKCSKGMANSHSLSAFHAFAMTSLQSSSIPSAARLQKKKTRILSSQHLEGQCICLSFARAKVGQLIGKIIYYIAFEMQITFLWSMKPCTLFLRRSFADKLDKNESGRLEKTLMRPVLWKQILQYLSHFSRFDWRR